MTFVLLVSLAAVMAAVMVMAWSLTVTLRPGEKLLRSLEAFEMVRRGAVPVAQRSLAERIRIVARRQCGILGKALMLPNSEARLSKQLSYAGNPLDWPMDRVIAAKGAVAIVGLFLGPFFGNAFGGGSGAVLGLILGPIGGFLLPNLLVYNAGTKHQANLQNTLTDVLDTMVISVEAGLGFDAALAQVAANGRGPFVREIVRVLQELQLGRSRSEALRAMAARTTVVEIHTFVRAVVQATDRGIPIAGVLREQAHEMRLQRRQRAEEAAQKVPVKILLPVIFCLFPALFMVVMGPAVVRIANIQW
ncbi:type II secretion system F family protein [Cryptosporangium arvum]|uniref:type II secretion system F family protein n=1 Tax=Cryptosporangium arvum TaxID=80871 RepID=UPI0004B21195|nr:type II secretion system F family protein [Cryptosporangium arvum]